MIMTALMDDIDGTNIGAIVGAIALVGVFVGVCSGFMLD